MELTNVNTFFLQSLTGLTLSPHACDTGSGHLGINYFEVNFIFFRKNARLVLFTRCMDVLDVGLILHY